MTCPLDTWHKCPDNNEMTYHVSNPDRQMKWLTYLQEHLKTHPLTLIK